MDRSTALSLGNVRSLGYFVLDDKVLWLGRWSACLSGFRGCFESKDVLFEKVLLDEFFQVLPEGPAVDGHVSLTIMIRSIFFCSRKCEIVPDWSWAPNSRLILDSFEDLVDGESQRSGMLFHLEGSEWAWRKDWKCPSLEGRLPLVLILGTGSGFVQRL